MASRKRRSSPMIKLLLSTLTQSALVFLAGYTIGTFLAGALQ